MWRTGVSIVVAGALSLGAVPALAQDGDTATRDAARTLGTAGVDDFQQGRFDDASDKLEKAYLVLTVPSLGLWSARALVKRNRFVVAAQRYREVVGLQRSQGVASVQIAAQEDAKRELAELLPQIPTLTVKTPGVGKADVLFRLDGQRLSRELLDQPRQVDPGPHHVELEYDGKGRTSDVTLAAGESKTVQIDFMAASSLPSSPHPVQPTLDSPHATQSSPRRTWSFIALGTGGAGLALGGVTGVIAMSKHSALKDSGDCVDTRCPGSKESEVNSLQTMRTLSTVGFVAGGVLAAVGLVLIVGDHGSEPAVTASLAFDGVRVGGAF